MLLTFQTSSVIITSCDSRNGAIMADEKALMEAIRSTSLDPSTRLGLIRDSGAVLYEYTGGSHAYGTSVPTSDRDMRGVICLPMRSYLSTRNPVEQISDDRKTEGKKKNDDLFYTVRRFFELLKGSNPNVIEALWIPDDCIVTATPEVRLVIENRNLFISKACLGSHFGYANDQIAKARGKNKKVNNPTPKERPRKLDFCRVIPCMPSAKGRWTHPDVESSKFPFRPIPMSDMPWVNLNHYHVSAVEHARCQYRLYYYGEEAKGVFRGDDMLVCESIPMEDEWARFSGILLYDEQEYDKAVKEWKSYWDWINNRNIHRWVDQESGKLTFDQKNMMHCMRLLWSGLNIIRNGEPIVRFSGDQLKYLMALRTGGITDYEAVMAKVEGLVAEMEEAAKSSSIPEDVDDEKIDRLYSEVSRMAWRRLFGETVS